MLSQLSYTPVSRAAPFKQSLSSTPLRVRRPSKLNNEIIQFTRSANSLTGISLLRKEVIQPHLPIRLPCYDFTPVANPTFGSALLAVRLLTSGITGSHGVTGGVYKARERIHRDMLIRDY